MTKLSLIDQLKELEQEHRDLDEVLIELQEKKVELDVYLRLLDSLL